MKRNVEYLIVGQGIAGTLLAWFLLKSDKSFLIIDDPKESVSSRIAAGVINPVTGRRIVKTWLADALIPFAEKTYREIENFFEVKILNHHPVIELLSSAKEYNDWVARSESSELSEYIDVNLPGEIYHDILQPLLRKILVKKSCWVDAGILLSSQREYFIKNGMYLNEIFEHDNVVLNSRGVSYKDITAEKIIFCEGIDALKNPFWKNLPFLPAKGELLTGTANMNLQHILNRKIFIAQNRDGSFKAGSTFNWNFKDANPTKEAMEYLKQEIKTILKIPFEITGHYAAVRPAVKGRRPLLGLHPVHKQVCIFNGIGTKGFLLAPYLASHLADFLSGKIELMPEVDIKNC